MSNVQKYNVSVDGQYPYEKYTITPIFDGTIQTNITYVCNNSIRYRKRPTNEVVSYLDNSNFQKYFYSTNTTYSLFNQTNISSNGITTGPNDILFIEETSSINFNSTDATLYFDASALKNDYRVLPEMNLFSVQVDNTTGESYGYLLYPKRLYLKPTASVSKSTNAWTLTTKIFAFSYLFKSYSLTPNESNSIESLASTDHRKYLEGTDTIPSNDIDYLATHTIELSLSASNTYINNPSPTFNNQSTYSYSKYTDTDYLISPDSTFITFSANFLQPDNTYSSAGQVLYDEYLSRRLPDFLPTFILRSTPTTQTFQLLQRDIHTGVSLSDPSNTIAKVDLNLNLNLFQYTANSSYIQTIPNTILGFSYIENGPYFKNSGQFVDSTLTTLNVGTTSYNNFSNVPAPDVIGQNITWTTTKPLHHYSFNASLYDIDGAYNDRFTLNFYLSSYAHQDTNLITINTKIVSDYATISYGFDLLDTDENIRYTIDGLTPETFTTISAYYILDGSHVAYDLLTSPWISAKNANTLYISYTPSPFQPNVTFRATLSTSSGFMDAFEGTHLVLNGTGEGLNGGIPALTIDIYKEQSNTIWVDSSFNTNENGWPYHDLTDSVVCWYYQPSDLNVTINGIDKSGNVLSNITPYAPINWDSTSMTVNLTGYGPSQITVYLSSQKYNQLAAVKTTPGLFDYFVNRTFEITPISLDNLDETRTIILSAGIPFGDTIYQIPTGTPLSWYWEYEDFTNPSDQPISAFYVDCTTGDYIDLSGNISTVPVFYNFNAFSLVSLVSSIGLYIKPPKNFYPEVRKITAYVSSNIRYPAVTGSYTFYLDDFPNNDIFSGDYQIYYTAFTTDPTYVLGDTRNNTNVITRSNDSDINFTLIPNKDVLPKIVVDDPTYIYWNVIDTVNGQNSYQYDPTNPLALSYLNTPDYILVSFNVLSGIAPGWTTPHNLSVSSFFYFIDTNEFYKPFEFINYPQFAWLDSPYLTLLTPLISSDGTLQYTDDTLPSYYTNSGYPSAYANKKSGTQPFWLSANKDFFIKYYYQNVVSDVIMTATSAFQLVELPYQDTDVGNYVGLMMTLTAYDEYYYPERMGTWFLSSDGTTLAPSQFNIVTRNVSANEDSDRESFARAAYILPYNDLVLNFTLTSNANLDLDFNTGVTIIQNISTVPDLNAPAIIVGGTVTYVLSSTFWTVSSNVDPISGIFTPFNLSIGDPYIPLSTGDLGIADLIISANPNILQQIPPSTFDNVSFEDYSGNRDLWNIA